MNCCLPCGLCLISSHSHILDLPTWLEEGQYLLCCQLEGRRREGKGKGGRREGGREGRKEGGKDKPRSGRRESRERGGREG